MQYKLSNYVNIVKKTVVSIKFKMIFLESPYKVLLFNFRKPLFIFECLSNNISHVRVEIKKKKNTSHFTYRGALP